MKLSRDTLLAALDLPAKITDSHILISSADGGFYINASDGDQTYITSIEGKAKDEIAPVCVNAKTLYRLFSVGWRKLSLTMELHLSPTHLALRSSRFPPCQSIPTSRLTTRKASC